MARIYANSYGWGIESVPIDDGDEPLITYKFLTLHTPVNPELGGHFGMTGTYGGHFYSPAMVARCERLEDESKRPEYKNTGPSHSIPGHPKLCSCGIYSQWLDYLTNRQDFSSNSLVKVEHPGNTRYTETGFRSSHGIIKHMWTHLSLDNDQLEKAKSDLGFHIERVPIQFQDWGEFVKNHPVLRDEIKNQIDRRDLFDRRIAGTCPDCSSTNTGLTPGGTRNGLFYRDSICKDCGNEWTRDEE
jgi:hypothetical protein